MKIAVFFGVYEAERSFAAHTLSQMLTILNTHDVHVHILDDSSASRVGEELARTFGNLPNVTITQVRLDQPLGYYRLMERTLTSFEYIAKLNQSFDYVIRLDADLMFARRDIARLFDENLLPKKGLIGISTSFRLRDFLLVLADLLPFGFRRAQNNGIISHKWQKRLRPVWWYDLGFKAFWNGFRAKYMPGSFQILSGETLKELHDKGYLSRVPGYRMGLVLGEDVATSILVKAINHPLHCITTLIPDWKSDLFLDSAKIDEQSILEAQYHVVHPLKSDASSMAIRKRFGTTGWV